MQNAVRDCRPAQLLETKGDRCSSGSEMGWVVYLPPQGGHFVAPPAELSRSSQLGSIPSHPPCTSH